MILLPSAFGGPSVCWGDFEERSLTMMRSAFSVAIDDCCLRHIILLPVNLHFQKKWIVLLCQLTLSEKTKSGYKMIRAIASIWEPAKNRNRHDRLSSRIIARGDRNVGGIKRAWAWYIKPQIENSGRMVSQNRYKVLSLHLWRNRKGSCGRTNLYEWSKPWMGAGDRRPLKTGDINNG